MSRMTKYLKQEATLERMQRAPDTLQPILDQYGEPAYEVAVIIPCRREKVLRDVITETGAAIKSDTRYYFNGTLPIDIGDKVNNKTVISIEEYTSNLGTVEGYLVYVA